MGSFGQLADSVDAERHYRQGVVEQVLAAIQDRWESDPDSRWDLFQGARRDIGGMGLTVLHPEEGECQTAREPNQLASALLIEWEECRILLGADVEYRGWEKIQSAYPDLACHAGLKYPHHGSLGAYHPAFAGNCKAERLWIMTPWNRGSRQPRYEDGEGLDKALEACSRIHLTGLPVRYDLQGTAPYHTTREALRDGREPPPEAQALSGGLSFSPLPDTEPLSHYVAAGFDASGKLQDLQHGAGTVVVRTEGEDK